MRAVTRHVIFEPDPRSLPDDPARFVLRAHRLVGTSDADTFDERAVRSWLERGVSAIEAASWDEIAVRLSRIGWWEFEDYIESPGP
jgi:hypothetical protein